MADRVAQHFATFNDAVRQQDWAAFLATFTPDAVMTFDGVTVGPYAGLDEIAHAYNTQPPTDTMTCESVARDGDTDIVRFAWDAGATARCASPGARTRSRPSPSRSMRKNVAMTWTAL